MDNQENNRFEPQDNPTEAFGDTQFLHSDDLSLESILAEDWSGDEAPKPAFEVEPEMPITDLLDAFGTDDTIRADKPATVPANDWIDTDPEEESPTITYHKKPVPVAEPQPAAEPAPAVESVTPPEQPKQPEQPKKKPAKKMVDYDPTAYIRPQKKRTYAFFGVPHLISTFIWILLIVVVGISLGRTLWVCCAEIMAFGKEPHQVTISVSKDDTIDQVASKLSNAKLIEYPQLFKTFATATGKDDNIRPGTYTLNASLDYNAMINAMSPAATREIVEIMFPEGYTCAQIFKLLEDNGVCTVQDLEDYLKNYDPEEGALSSYWFLENAKWGDKYCLEGYLAPDTYEFYVGDEPERILTKFLNEFDDRFTDIMKEDFETLQYNHMQALHKEGYSSQYIDEHKLTLHDVLTLASIVQRETGSSSESFDIASVFYNRLAAGIELGSDATVYYAIGDYFSEKGELTMSDLDSNSPYNTRKYKGIPPGPICNPGTYALYAALDPNTTSYKYFVYDSDAREHLFSETLEEHERKCRELGLW